MSRSVLALVSVALAVLAFGAPGAPVPPGAGQKPELSAPVTYKDLMLVLVTKEGAAAVVFDDPQELSVAYKFRDESADGKTTKDGQGKVFERYTDGKYDGGELDLKAGPIELRWSRGGLDRGVDLLRAREAERAPRQRPRLRRPGHKGGEPAEGAPQTRPAPLHEELTAPPTPPPQSTW